MTERRFGPWVLDVDVNATRDLYAQIDEGAEDCSCDHCQDWARARESAVPQEARDLLTSLGVDWRREAEVYIGDPRRSSHSCAGWFHIVGRIAHGPPAHSRRWFFRTVALKPNLVPVTEGYEAYVHAGLPPMKPATEAALRRGLPIFTLEFHTTRHRWDGGDDESR